MKQNKEKIDQNEKIAQDISEMTIGELYSK